MMKSMDIPIIKLMKKGKVITKELVVYIATIVVV